MLLTTTKLFDDVRERTGLEHVHSGGVDERLERLIGYMRDSLNLDEAGRIAAHETVLDLLISRTGLLHDRQANPGIAEQPIERPIFVTGLPRSGTTFLHYILAADPDHRSPRWWETLYPSPPPGPCPAENARRARADDSIAGFIKLQPDILRSHPYFDEGGMTLMECEALAVTDFRRIVRAIYWRVPGVLPPSFNATDDIGFFEYHHKVLQALQWQRPHKRWALKGTEHHVRLEALKSVYPDAIVIWLHRDPQKVFPSLMALLSNVAEGTSRKPIDRPAFGRQILGNYRLMLEKAMTSPFIEHGDVHHLRYADFIADPVGAVAQIYRKYTLPFTQTQVQAINAWKDDPANRGNRHGRFRYSLDDFKMTPQELEAFVAPYREKFNIPME